MGRACCYFLKRIDYFGVQQTLRVNSYYKYSSRFGGFTFLMYILFAVGYFFYSFKSYINKENKNVIMSEEVVLPAPELNMKNLNFTLAFGLTFDNNGTIANDILSPYLNFDLNYVIMTQTKKTKESVNVRLCNNEDFPFLENSAIEILQLRSNYCLNYTNYTIAGLYTDEKFSYLEYTISIKKDVINDTKTFEYLRTVFENFPLKLNFFFVDIALDVNNLTNPNRFYVNSFTNYLNFNNFQKQNFDFTQLNYIDDTSIIFDQPSVNHFMKFYSEYFYYFNFKNRSNTANTDKDKFYRLYIRSNQYVKSIKREFQKFPAFIAEVSGIVSNALVVLFIVINFINDFKLKKSLINKVFNFKESIIHRDKIIERMKEIIEISRERNFKKCENGNNDEDINLKTNPNDQLFSQSHSEFPFRNSELKNEKKTYVHTKSKSSTDKTFTENKFPLKHNIKPEFLKRNNKEDKFSYKHAFDKIKYVKTNELISTKDKPFEINFCELVVSLFCCSSNKLKYRKQLYQKGREKVHYYLDVLTLVKKFQEFDIVKTLIFSKEQLSILNFLSKPIVSIAHDTRKWTNQKNKVGKSFETEDFSNMVLRDSQISEEEVEKLYLSYCTLKYKNSVNDIDHQLMKKLEKKILDIVD